MEFKYLFLISNNRFSLNTFMAQAIYKVDTLNTSFIMFGLSIYFFRLMFETVGLTKLKPM